MRPDAKFLVIHLSVKNLDNKQRSIAPFKLLDYSRREYSSKSMLSNSELDWLVSLNPGVEKKGQIVFDIPGYREYWLLLKGGWWSEELAYVQVSWR